MNIKNDGNDNVIAGRDAYIIREKSSFEQLDTLPKLFGSVDAAFSNILGKNYITRWGNEEAFSSEKLFGSLVTIGIPVSVAITIPRKILPLLQSCKEISGVETFDGNTIKRCVLEVLTGLQFMEPFASQEEVSTWSAAYIRRYGNSNEFIHVIDNGYSRELNHEFVKEEFIPHILEKALGLHRGVDAVQLYKGIFSAAVVDRMAREIIRLANGLNLYEIQYRTLFRLVTEVMMKPPHPWMVNPSTQAGIVSYNIEKAKNHCGEITSRIARENPRHALPCALECAAHSCAAILARYGFLLGVEGKYGLDELIRTCGIRLDNKNLALWDFCELNLFEQNLKEMNLSIKSFSVFLTRLSVSLRADGSSDADLLSAFSYCEQLYAYACQLSRQ